MHLPGLLSRHLTFTLKTGTAPRQLCARQIVGVFAGDIDRGAFVVEQILGAAGFQASAAGQVHLAFIAIGLDGAERDVDLELALIAPAIFCCAARIGFSQQAMIDVRRIDERVLAAAVGIGVSGLRIAGRRRCIALGIVHRRDVIVIGRGRHIGLLALAACGQHCAQRIDPRGILPLAIGPASAQQDCCRHDDDQRPDCFHFRTRCFFRDPRLLPE